MENITRHDIPESVKKLLTIAEEKGLIDGLDIFTLGAKFGRQYAPDWQGLIDELVEYSFATRHGDGGKKHSVIAGYADKAYVEIRR